LNLRNYHWIIFTSVNGVEAFFHQLYALDLDTRWLKDIRIGAIGSATASALEHRGLHPDCIPKKYTSQGLVAELQRHGIAGCRILLPRADIAGKELTLGLARLGAEVHEVTAYRTTPDIGGISQAKQMILAGEIDIVTFTSSSTVANLAAALGKEREVMNKVLIACIGPGTTATATKAGLRVDMVARRHTMAGLIEAMEDYFQREGK